MLSSDFSIELAVEKLPLDGVLLSSIQSLINRFN